MVSSAITRAIGPIVTLLLAIWIIELINYALSHRFNLVLGLRPREISGLVGVPLMPFLHTSISHTVANTLPLIVLGIIALASAPSRFWRASIAIIIFSGFAIWLMARPGLVVGSSGLIFGWFGYIVALGALERSPRAVAGAIAVIFLYGGMIWGTLPENGALVSWEAHLLGTLTGALVAYFQPRMAVRRRT